MYGRAQSGHFVRIGIGGPLVGVLVARFIFAAARASVNVRRRKLRPFLRGFTKGEQSHGLNRPAGRLA
jgi:hypothetical protein